jgi:flagellar basal-body rod protein FlgB
MVSKLDEAFRFHQTALSLRAGRQELLAANIANADTPNFKARDIDFASALKGALAGSTARLDMAQSTSNHLSGSNSDSILGAPALYRRPLQPSADGNTVEMDVERAQFADNALRYEASVKFMTDEIKDVMQAIQG